MTDQPSDREGATLSQCPRCGSAAFLHEADTNPPTWTVFCRNLKCALGTPSCESAAEATEQWNPIAEPEGARAGMSKYKCASCYGRGVIRIVAGDDEWTEVCKDCSGDQKQEGQGREGGQLLAKHQPCGCIVCTCENTERCEGCGSKHCGWHDVGKIPNPVYQKQRPGAGGDVQRAIDKIRWERIPELRRYAKGARELDGTTSCCSQYLDQLADEMEAAIAGGGGGGGRQSGPCKACGGSGVVEVDGEDGRGGPEFTKCYECQPADKR